jgi:hypothetical protein
MSLAEILDELRAFSIAERQLLIRRAIELDEPGLSPDDERMIESRLAEHADDASSAITFEAMKSIVRSEYKA